MVELPLRGQITDRERVSLKNDWIVSLGQRIGVLIRIMHWLGIF